MMPASTRGASKQAQTALVVPSDKYISVDADTISMNEVAKMLGCSVSTIKRRTTDGILQAFRNEKGEYRYDLEHIKQVKVQKVAHVSSTDREIQVGERDAVVIEGLESGYSVARIVIDNKIPFGVVVGLRRAWLETRQAEASHPVMCGSCNSRWADPTTARCEGCFNKSYVLGPNQRIATMMSDGSLMINGVRFVQEKKSE